MKCCNNEIQIKSGNSDGKKMYYAECPTCGRKYKDENKSKVEDMFSVPTPPKNYEIQPIPAKAADIVKWGNANIPALIQQSAQFIDKPATQRMIEKNLRYVSGLSGGSWDKIWSTKEGQDSISYALSESLYHAAVLPDMGSIVPFGTIAEFVPSIECYKFALETGKNAPFKDIQIDLIHENDQTENSQEDGNFLIKIKRGIPRGEILAVVVSAIRIDTGNRIGDIYDVDRLLKKAEHHSPSYKNFLIDRDAFKRMEVEGKLKADADGRKYYEKVIPKKDGGTWTKKIYEGDITNPYDGPDRPEMLRKAAGKSFFRPYMKTRNASAMADEWQSDPIETREQAADTVLTRAAGQFTTSDTNYDQVKGRQERPIKDAEIIEPVQEKQSKQPAKKQSANLFDNEGDL
jgi:hypothetical protein